MLQARLDQLVDRAQRADRHILFIGHRNHDEAVGTGGEAPESILVVESPEEVATLPVVDPARLAYVRRVGGPVFGDPGAYGRIRKAGQL